MNTERGHLDAETVAAWLDGGLDAVSLAAAEAHASNCERCQALLATAAKTLPLNVDAAPGVAAGFSRRIATSWWKWWMAPLAATAAAVTLWMVVPQQQLQQSKATVASDADVAARAPDAPAAARDAAPPPAQTLEAAAKKEPKFDEVKRKAEAPANQDQRQEAPGKLAASGANVADAAAARERRDAKTEERFARAEAEPARVAAAPPAPAAPPPPAASPAEIGGLRNNAAVSQLRKQSGPLELLSPDPQRRWRVVPTGIERTEDGGRTWVLVLLAQGETIAAGASPSPMVCWMVGRAGLVLIATDGTNFTRLPFPERVDLTAVSSPELRIAVVTAADGRVFRTENAGRTWIRQ